MKKATRSLDPIFWASSVAVVGASGKRGSLGAMVYGNLKRDFPGTLYPVNSRHLEVLGDRSYADVGDLPEDVDLVLILVPAREVPGVVLRSIRAGHRSAYVLSSGFGEAGPEGLAIQLELSRLANEHNFLIVGPNCIGCMNLHNSLMANFSLNPDAERPGSGPVAILSQSGGFGSHILNRAVTAGVAVGMFASTGNECDVTVSEMLAYVVERPEVQLVAVFAEAIRRSDLFVSAAERAAEMGKAIISVSPGASPSAARAALSHTGSIIGSSQVYRSICRQYGIIQADSIEQLVDYALVAQDGRRMNGNRLGVVTPSGGAGVLIAATASEVGLEVPELDSEAQNRIAAVMPPFASARNPIDMTAGSGAYTADSYRQILNELSSTEVDAVLAVCWAGEGPYADSVVNLYHAQSKPIIPSVTIDPHLIAARGVPTFTDPVRAVKALAALAAISSPHYHQVPTFAANQARVQQIRDVLGHDHLPLVLESEAKQILAAYGIPVTRERLCRSEEDTVVAATQIGGPVALKALSYDLPHKSDKGGLVLGVVGEAEVRAAYRRLMASFAAGSAVTLDGVLVQEMVSGRLEVALGIERDPVFGPMVAVGLGGVHIEMFGAPELLRPPFFVEQAIEAVERVAGGRLCASSRGLSAPECGWLAQAMTDLGVMALELEEVTSVDVNPLIVSRHGLTAVDALMVLGEPRDAAGGLANDAFTPPGCRVRP